MAVKVTLKDCPIGLFINDHGGLCLKTEYGNNEGRIDAFIVSSGEYFWGDEPQTIASQRKQLVTPVTEDILQRAREMRTAIDLIEGALMRFGELVDLPPLFEGTRPEVVLTPKVTVGQMRGVCGALEECTRIINSDEYLFAKDVS